MNHSSIPYRQQALLIAVTLVTLVACFSMLWLARLHFFDLRSSQQVTVLDMLPIVSSGMTLTVDQIGEDGHAESIDPRRVAHLSKRASVTAHGWAFDDLTHTPARAAAIQIDDSQTFPIAYGLSRPDVAQAFGRPALQDVGWEARIPLDAIDRLGPHRVELIFLLADGIHAYKAPLLTFDDSPKGKSDY